MTLCVAAECVHDGEARFVFAKDFAVQTEISSAEIEAKWTSIGKARLSRVNSWFSTKVAVWSSENAMDHP